eukprot:4152306-Amphidinium_carterae.1
MQFIFGPVANPSSLGPGPIESGIAHGATRKCLYTHAIALRADNPLWRPSRFYKCARPAANAGTICPSRTSSEQGTILDRSQAGQS